MSKLKVNAIEPTNPVVPVDVQGPTFPTFNGTPLNYPPLQNGEVQSTVGVFAGAGAPDNSLGTNGSFYLRSDGNAGTTIYQKRAGTWTGLV